MKKEIGELTLNEVLEIKQACLKMNSCKECNKENPTCFSICDALEVRVFDKDLLKQEVEIE